MASGDSDCGSENERCVRILCRSKIASFCRERGFYWLIGSPLFLPPFTIVSALRCLHYSLPGDPYSPDYSKESDDLRTILLRGFTVIGALFVSNTNWEENARKAVDSCLRMKQDLLYDEAGCDIIAAAADSITLNINFFVSEPSSSSLESISTVHYEVSPEKYLWENACLLRCQLEFKLPVYAPLDGRSDVEMFSSATNAAMAKFRDPLVVYLVEGSEVTQQPILLHSAELSFNTAKLEHKPHEDKDSKSMGNTLSCSYFSKPKGLAVLTNADTIRVSVFFNHSGSKAYPCSPTAEYFPASEPTNLIVADIKLDVLCYTSKDFLVSSAVSRLVIPGLADQLAAMSKVICPKLLQQPQLFPYHFSPPGILHPITAIYDLRYGESEKAQAEIRRSVHLRLGLPLDRPLLLIANSLAFGSNNMGGSGLQRGVIKDVHVDIPKSGVSRGLASLVEGSYEYYHYLQDGYDDSGWGCAYRSLQTIISWFRLQHYTCVQVPSHREIQQTLVEIGDKEPSFVGSREWIGAIELSFVLDKLLGVTSKIINVRSGAELPEKCRELSIHFETQGTPVMIGGGVLAYTLLGVEYNEVTGDCAFLILDPHYTGSDDRKKIMNGGWCGWKKAVDSKGRNFFLHDKFYNLLLPQRPNMV